MSSICIKSREEGIINLGKNYMILIKGTLGHSIFHYCFDSCMFETKGFFI